jgi:hypothetical protein
VAGGELDVAQGDAGVEGGHDEAGAQHVGVDATGAGASSDRADPAMLGAPIEPMAVAATQERPLVAFADGEVDRSGGAGHE